MSQFHGALQTSEVIITNERLEHIRDHHPMDVPLFERYGRECVERPDYIIEDSIACGTIYMIKKLPDTNLNLIVRLALEADERHPKHSVMTFYRIRERNLEKLIRNSQMLYKKE